VGRRHIYRMITTIDKSALKAQLIEACLHKQLALINDFKSRVNELLETEGLGNEEAYDNDQLASNTQRTVEVNAMNEALLFANAELRVLQQLKNAPTLPFEQAELGAVVVTNLNTFFVAISTEQFEVNGTKYIGLSGYSPLFRAMEGKSKGQKFSYQGITYHIQDLF
jgi:hypothetical protein